MKIKTVFPVFLLVLACVYSAFDTNSAGLFERYFNRVIDQIQVEAVPPKFLGQKIAGQVQIELFGFSQEDRGRQIDRELFAGGFKYFENLPPAQVKSIFICGISFVLLSFLFSVWLGSYLGSYFGWAVAGLSSIVLSVFFAVGWDELFINLRHSYMLTEHFMYSYNSQHWAEASVDFLPFFLAGLAGLLGAPLIESILCITLAGNLFVMLAGYLIIRSLTQNIAAALLGSSLLGFFPSLLFVGGTGFTATLFSAWALLGIYFLFFERSVRGATIGKILLGTLTLCRTEGILLAFLLYILFQISRGWKIVLSEIKNQSLRASAVLDALIMSGPFFLSCTLRELVFGAALPNPIVFKNTFGDLGYLVAGLHQLKAGIVAYHLDILASFLLLLFLFSTLSAKDKLSLLGTLVCLFFFTLSYYSGGGDWFPLEWNRYMMPFTLYVYLITFALLANLALALGGRFWAFHFLIYLFAISYLCGSTARSSSAFGGTYYSQRLSDQQKWARVNSLASFGDFLNRSTAFDSIIASPEMSTLMYFAQRDLLDLLGIANPEIANRPLQPRIPGDLMHRKRDPQTLSRHLPHIIALNQMVHLGATKGSQLSPQEAGAILSERFFWSDMLAINYYRAGSFEYLKKLGYRHVAVFYTNVFYNYLVHKSALRDHKMRLRQLGAKLLGKVKVSYQVPDYEALRFSADGVL